MSNRADLHSKEEGDWYCPLLKRAIEQGLCLDINYQREGAFRPDVLKDVQRQLQMSVEQISAVCESCPNNPLKRNASIEKYPHLHSFIGGYFHQDWRMESPNPRQVVEAFIELHSADARKDLADEIGNLLASASGDAELRKTILQDLRSSYDPAVDGKSMKDWVNSVRDQLAASWRR